MQYKKLQQSLKGRRIAGGLHKHILSASRKWKDVLRRLLVVTLFLAPEVFPFSGRQNKN
jgi:hypothetical protein